MTTPRPSLALLLFLAFQGLYGLTASGRVGRVPDEYEVHCQAESLWERGTQAVDQLPPEAFFGKVRRDGRQYAPYGPGTAFLVLPHHALGRAVAWVSGVRHDPRLAPDPWREVVAAFGSLATATWAALAVLGAFRAARALGAEERRAALVALLLGAATFLWPYGTFFYAEPITAALLVWAVALELEGRRVLGAVALFLAFTVKGTNLLFAAPLALLPAARALPAGTPTSRDALLRGLRAAAPALLAAAAAAGVHAEWNTHRFGSPFDFGYAWGEQLRAGEAPRPFLLSELPRGLFGLLLSPGKSLLLFAPPLLLSLLRLPALWRSGADGRAVALATSAAAAGALLFFGSYMYWEGGYSFGPRHLLPLVPLLLLPLAVGPAPSRRALAAVLALGITVQALGSTVSFMEDQVMGDDRARPTNTRYYAVDESVPAGRPLNRYRLDYCPLVTYPPLLVRHLTSDDPPVYGQGLELLPLHLTRVRDLTGGRVPGALIITTPLAFALLTLGAAAAAWKRLARS